MPGDWPPFSCGIINFNASHFVLHFTPFGNTISIRLWRFVWHLVESYPSWKQHSWLGCLRLNSSEYLFWTFHIISQPMEGRRNIGRSLSLNGFKLSRSTSKGVGNLRKRHCRNFFFIIVTSRHQKLSHPVNITTFKKSSPKWLLACRMYSLFFC